MAGTGAARVDKLRRQACDVSRGSSSWAKDGTARALPYAAAAGAIGAGRVAGGMGVLSGQTPRQRACAWCSLAVSRCVWISSDGATGQTSGGDFTVGFASPGASNWLRVYGDSNRRFGAV